MVVEVTMELTKNTARVDVKKSPKSPDTLLAVFRVKNEAQYKAVGPVARTFRKWSPSYNDMSISFAQEKAYDRPTKKEEQ